MTAQLPNQPLNYQPRAVTARRRANLLRAAVLVGVVLLSQVVIVLLFHPLIQYSENQAYFGGGIIGTPAAPITYGFRPSDDFPRTRYAIQASGYLLVVLLTQWLFLRARGSFRLDRLGGARLTPVSAVIAGLIAMLLCVGMLATLFELPELWESITIATYRTEFGTQQRQSFAFIWMIMLVTWMIWASIFWQYGRSLDRYTFIGKVLRKLFAGTILELFVAYTTHAWVINKRGSDCYCTRGSYTGIVFGMTALVWLFGPGLWFVVQREKRRRERVDQ